jgi:lipid-A-disaccharide synthase
MATARTRACFEAQWQKAAPGVEVLWLDGRARVAMAAADAVLVASGTATLETLLSKRPMVVAYRLGAITAQLIRRLGLVKVPYFSQPNLLLGRRAVVELLQEQVTPAALGRAVLDLLEDDSTRGGLEAEFLRVHESLRVGGAARAADAVLELAGMTAVDR